MNCRMMFVMMIAGSSLLACAKKATGPTHVSTSTFPLAEGSRWHYEGFIVFVNSTDSTETDTAGLAIDRFIIGPDTSLQITGVVAYDDSISVESHYDEIWRKWIGMQNNKLMLYASDIVIPGNDSTPVPFTTPKTLLDFPLSYGKSWISDTLSGYTTTYSVIGNEVVETPSGPRDCDVVYSVSHDDLLDNRHSLTYQWYSDEGLMRYENTFLNVDPPPGAWYEKYRSFEIVNMEIQ